MKRDRKQNDKLFRQRGGVYVYVCVCVCLCVCMCVRMWVCVCVYLFIYLLFCMLHYYEVILHALHNYIISTKIPCSIYKFVKLTILAYSMVQSPS